jgi:hypothetical protein
MVAAEVDEVSTPFALGRGFRNAHQTTLAGQPIPLGVPGRAGQNDFYRVRTTAPRSEITERASLALSGHRSEAMYASLSYYRRTARGADTATTQGE